MLVCIVYAETTYSRLYKEQALPLMASIVVTMHVLLFVVIVGSSTLCAAFRHGTSNVILVTNHIHTLHNTVHKVR